MAALQRILVATDFSETSERALGWAIELAARLRAAVTVVHVYQIPVLGFPEGGAAVLVTAEIAAQIVDGSRAALERTVDRYSGRGVPVDGVLREGVAWEQIESVSDELDADMIVIGTHGRRGLARALLGSVAEKVVRTAHRPVVTIRGPQE